jgi:hypothetical protein
MAKQPKTMTVKVLKSFMYGGVNRKVGETLEDIPAQDGRYFVSCELAKDVTPAAVESKKK